MCVVLRDEAPHSHVGGAPGAAAGRRDGPPGLRDGAAGRQPHVRLIHSYSTTIHHAYGYCIFAAPPDLLEGTAGRQPHVPGGERDAGEMHGGSLEPPGFT